MSGRPRGPSGTGGSEYTLGAEEEVMLLNPHDWSLAQQIDRVLPALPDELRGARDPRDAQLGARDRHGRTPDGGGLGRGAAAAAPHAGRRAGAARAARRQRRHPPVHRVARDRGVHRPALRVGLRLDARAGPPRADLRPARARRRCRPRGRHPAVQPDARAPAPPAGAVGELAVLAGPRHRPGLGAHPAVPGVPARRHPARVPTTTTTGSRRSTC